MLPLNKKNQVSAASGRISRVGHYGLMPLELYKLLPATTTTTSTSSTSTTSTSSTSTSSTTHTTTTSTSTSTTSTSTTTVISAGTTRVQAENWNGASGAAIETTSDTGGGYNVGNLAAAGRYVEYLVYPNVSGARTFSFRIAAQDPGGVLTVTEGGTTLATVTVPQTGGYQTWQTITTSFSLTAGPHLLRFTVGATPWNINWFEYNCHAQMVPKEVTIDANIHGFYEFLPDDYYNTGGNYPLIIHLHGVDEEGSSPTQLTSIISQSIPKSLSNGMTNAFTVGSTTYKFIVLAPQMAAWHAGGTDVSEVQDMINYALANYRVDANRIYVVGYSMGAGETMDYVGAAGKAVNIAAAISMATAAPDNTTGATNIAAANLPMLFFHNSADPRVDSTQSTAWKNDINSHSPTPLAVLTMYSDTVHDCWTRTVNPAFAQNYPGVGTVNIYQWLLSYARNL